MCDLGAEGSLNGITNASPFRGNEDGHALKAVTLARVCRVCWG